MASVSEDLVRQLEAPKAPPPTGQQQTKTTGDLLVESLFGEAPTTGEAEQRKTHQEQADARVRGVLMRQFGTDQLGDKELGSVFDRFRLGLADNPSDAQAIFKKIFPKGELLYIPGDKNFDQEVLFRKDPQSPFARLDDPTIGGNFGADIAEFVANDIGAMTGETAALTLPQLIPQGRAATLFGKFIEKSAEYFAKRPLRSAALGAGTGEIAQSVTESALGLSGERSTREVGQRAAGQAFASFVGGFILDRAGRFAYNLAAGRQGIFGPRRAGAERILKAQERMGLKPIPPDLLIQNQLIRRMAGQARAQTSAGPIRLEELQMGVAKNMQDLAAANKKLVDVNPDGTTTIREFPDIPSLERLAIKERRDIETSVQGRLGLWRRTLAQSGANVLGAVDKFRAKLPKDVRDALARGGFPEVGRLARFMSVDEMGKIAEWDIRARGRISLAYAKASQIESPNFDMTAAHNVALEVWGHIGQSLDPKMQPLKELAREILDTPPQLGDTIEMMTDALGNPMHVTVDPTSRLRLLRSRAMDIAHSQGAGEDTRAVQALASRLGGTLRETLFNPTNTSPAFRKQWSRANKLARDKFAMDERFTFMTEAASNPNMRQLGKTLSNLQDVNNVETYKGLKAIMTDREWGAFKDGIATELLRKPFQLTKTLEAADPDVLRAAFTSSEIAALRLGGKKFDRLGEAKIMEVMKTQTQIPLIARDLIQQNNSAGIHQLVSIVNKNGGPDGPFGRMIRAGFLEHLFGIGELVGDFPMRGVAMDFKKGIIQVNQARLDEELRRLHEIGADALFSKDELQMMSHGVAVTDALRQMSDAGTSIAGAETASQLRGQFFGGEGGQGGVRTLFENIAVGRLLVSQFGQDLIAGKSKKQAVRTPLRSLVLMGALANTLYTDAKSIGDRADAIVDWGVNVTGHATEYIKNLGAETLP